ncbi:Sec63 Brl domain-containing protein [Cercophora samala]|uniref:RNA helicase n=1 Tax=Cercophora samala TaxID=330535 RepID=A0AA39ZKU8_9PEZI|nr:Sec63 Brl domain-containing protein [Cercophora samala]
MSDYQRDVSQYKYSAMSNLVLQADRRFVTRRTDEATGDPESLAGRLSIKDMGARVGRDAAPKTKKTSAMPNVERGDVQEGADILQHLKDKKKKGKTETRGGGILASTDMIEGIIYRPRTQPTRDAFNLILTIVAEHLGDLPHDTVRSAADAVLEFLKDDDLKDFDKKKEIDGILGESMDPKQFNELVNLGKKITDYDAQDDEDEEMGDARPDVDDEIDGRQGVAVNFENDEDDDGMVDVVRDESSSEDEDEDIDDEDRPELQEVAEGGEAGTDRDEEEAGLVDGETMVIDSAPNGKDKSEDKNFVPARDIDAYWLQRQIGRLYPDAHIQHDKTSLALKILSGEPDEPGGEEKQLRDIENDLMELFDYEHHEIVQKLIENREKVVWLTRLARAENQEERDTIEREMASEGLRWILDELHGKSKDDQKKPKMEIKMDIDSGAFADGKAQKQEKPDGQLVGGLQPRKLINLENLVFDQGNHLNTNPKVRLPEGTTKRTFKGYEEIHVPPPKKRNDPSDVNIPISEMPEWAQPPFSTTKSLNKIQSKCFPTAFHDDGNMLVCAPTGSGKTNVSMLTILREIGKNRNERGEIDLDAFKIVYIAPLKALVQEQVGNFGKRLEPYGIKVSELTGDRQLTKQQISETQIIVTTPEKWDVITRKATDISYTNLVRLIIIDEIHLLHDDRGPVLEIIVSRTIRKTEQTGEPVRIVGLSATLPNYKDVASFLRVDMAKGLFHFDGSFRPCPLRQEFIGITERKAIKQLKTMNDITYTKVIEHVGTHRNQMLIFVHSRKETAKTAKYIRDKALEMDTINQILKHDAGTREVLSEAANAVNNTDLKDILPYGFGIHHAGMSRADRTDVEDLFSSGHIQVLVCTATLAWGVNLPAHTVIIKGTQVYSPEKGSWVELSPQDVLQMLGRAGRPQFDTYGEGIIITTQGEMTYYLSLLNQQLPIESQFASKLVDNLNAEIVLGNVRSRDEGVEWLGYTYLFVRMLRSPGLYSVGAEYEDDEALEQKRVDLIHSAATVLKKSNLIKYDEKTGKLQSTELGRIASHYYITNSSMDTYNKLIQPSMNDVELFRVFAQSGEFKYIPVRQEEKLELAKLLARVPIPVKESIEEPTAKINVLLQAYISRLRLDGLALMADMVYVTQSAGRILRAIFEITLKKGWASVAKLALNLCKMAEKRMWPTMSPLRQFPSCPAEIVRKAERIEVPFSSYLDLDPPRMGELLGMPKAGKTVCALVAKFPRVEVQASVQPMTRSMLRVELTITPNFEWDVDVHGLSESFWIMVEDCDGEDILFHDQFILRKDYAESDANEHIVEFTVPITEPMPPNYFISVISDRWMHSETRLPVSFQQLILPERFPPHTELLDLQPLPVTALKAKDYAALYPDWTQFNKIQTQTFNSLYGTDNNVLVAAPTGSGKTVCAEFALLRHWNKQDSGRAVYIAPFQELVDLRYQDWQKRFANLRGGKDIVKLTGETTADLKLLEQGDLILATPLQWDVLSRQWKRRKNVQTVELFIADELHMLGGQMGYIYEIIVSRMHYIRTQTELPVRIVGLSVSLANARDVGEWIDAKKHDIYNFSPHVRPVPLELHIQSYTIPHFPSLMLAMAKPTYLAITQMSPDQPALIFVPSRKQTRATARDILTAALADDDEDRFLNVEVEQIQKLLERVQEPALAEALSHGVGYYHEALSQSDKRIVMHLYKNGAIQVLIASRDVCWELDCTAHLVIVMGTQYFEGREHRYVDYPLSEVLQMFGKASQSSRDGRGRGVLMVPAVKREYYKKFLNEALPVESHLHNFLQDAFVTEISTRMIESGEDAINWATFTYFYRRLLANPSYYSLTDPTHEGLSQYLSDMVEATLKELSESKIVDFDEDEGTVAPQNAAMIAAYYNISYITMQTFLLSLTAKTKLKGILEIVTSATEFESIQIRRHEEAILRRIYDSVPVKMAEPAFDSPHFKAFVLVQAHFSRMNLPIDLAKDQEVILTKIVSLLNAIVDILSSDGRLNAMNAMEMSQMVVQAMWDRDSPLKQIPNFTSETVKVANKYDIRDIFDFMSKMDPDENPDYNSLIKDLGLTQAQLAQAANFTNSKYPEISLEVEVEDKDEIRAGEPAYLKIAIEREIDEDEEYDPTVHAPFYPGKKTESWWLVVGEEKTKELLAIKRITVGRNLNVRLEFTVPTAGHHELKLFFMSDSYMGVDQEPSFAVEVAEGMDVDEDEDDEEEDEEVMLTSDRVTRAKPLRHCVLSSHRVAIQPASNPSPEAAPSSIQDFHAINASNFTVCTRQTTCHVPVANPALTSPNPLKMSREASPVAPASEAAQPVLEKKEDAPIAPAAEDLKEAIAAESKAAVESAPAEEASDKPEEAPEKTAEQAEEKPDVEMTDAADAAEAEAPSQPPADNNAGAAPKAKANRKSIGAGEGKGKKLNRKASKPRILHIDAQPGDYFFVKLKGHPQWPVIICDEDMLPDSLLKSRPVTAKRQDGTYRDDYADGAKKVADRTFPVMYLYTNEFGWVPNGELIDLDPEEVKGINTDKMRKDLQAAHKLAAEQHPLQFYKDVLDQYQAEQDEKERAKAAKAAATPKGKKKSSAVVDEDVDMEDDAENSTPPKEKKTKKRKADEPAETPQRTESVKKTKIKLTSNATPKTTNGTTPSAKAKPDAKSTKAKSKKAKDGEDKKAEKEASEAPKEPELSPQEQRERKEREVLFLRHKLQKGLLTRDQEPKAEEMATMSEYITKLEGFPNLEVSIIRTTKINKVLKAILKLENIPKEKEFNFKSRSQVLLNKWNELLAVDGGAAAPAPAAKAVNGTAPKETKTNGVKADEPAKTEKEDAKEEPKEKKDESPAEEKTKEKSEEASEPADKMDVDEAKSEAVEAST